MFLFSEVHNWQNNEAVKQIRVFTSEFAKNDFDSEYNSATKDGKNTAEIETFSDTGNGVAYKIRAVLDAYGSWIPLIRCGHTGCVIWESNLTQTTWQEAMTVALCELQNKIIKINFPIIH